MKKDNNTQAGSATADAINHNHAVDVHHTASYYADFAKRGWLSKERIEQELNAVERSNEYFDRTNPATDVLRDALTNPEIDDLRIKNKKLVGTTFSYSGTVTVDDVKAAVKTIKRFVSRRGAVENVTADWTERTITVDGITYKLRKGDRDLYRFGFYPEYSITDADGNTTRYAVSNGAKTIRMFYNGKLVRRTSGYVARDKAGLMDPVSWTCSQTGWVQNYSEPDNTKTEKGTFGLKEQVNTQDALDIALNKYWNGPMFR